MYNFIWLHSTTDFVTTGIQGLHSFYIKNATFRCTLGESVNVLHSSALCPCIISISLDTQMILLHTINFYHKNTFLSWVWFLVTLWNVICMSLLWYTTSVLQFCKHLPSNAPFLTVFTENCHYGFHQNWDIMQNVCVQIIKWVFCCNQNLVHNERII
jgi:hypothetical protein